MNRVRAIAANRTQSSLTGGCFEPRIVRICTEFWGSEGEPDRPDATGPGSVRLRCLFGSRGERSRVMEPYSSACPRGRQIAVGGRKTKDPHPFLRDLPTTNAQASNRIAHLSLRSTWRARNSQRSINASHCSFESLAHNSRRGAAALLIRTSLEIEQPHRVTPG